MKKIIYLILTKVGFLLIIIGFFLPIVLNLNGFQVTEYLSGQLLEIDNLKFNPMMNSIGFLSYLIFICSFIGVLRLVLQIIKKNKNNIFVDCGIVIINSIALIIIINEINKIYTVYLETLVITGVTENNIEIINILGYISPFLRDLVNNLDLEIEIVILQIGIYFIIFGIIISIVSVITQIILRRVAPNSRLYKAIENITITTSVDEKPLSKS